ncbi:hypothetical protein CRG98_000298 [Punica granatum]|uniref:Uncharacterized protein n=1 Tax=Punica granatum TaxID=22663 RepID=A0A2I0LF28_PUNGR|nr:hypothetical protein CRG98_000298 [Punica granatum]
MIREPINHARPHFFFIFLTDFSVNLSVSSLSFRFARAFARPELIIAPSSNPLRVERAHADSVQHLEPPLQPFQLKQPSRVCSSGFIFCPKLCKIIRVGSGICTLQTTYRHDPYSLGSPMQPAPHEKTIPIDWSSPNKRHCQSGSVLGSFYYLMWFTLYLFANFKSAQVEPRYEPPITVIFNQVDLSHFLKTTTTATSGGFLGVGIH